jgi:hypothetical protein
MTVVLWILGGAAALYGLHRLGLWMESKNWIYYRRRPRSGAGFVLDIAAAVDPGARHVVEARETRAEQQANGDDDDERPPEDRVADLNRRS